jgi:hypothetical protein
MKPPITNRYAASRNATQVEMTVVTTTVCGRGDGEGTVLASKGLKSIAGEVLHKIMLLADQAHDGGSQRAAETLVAGHSCDGQFRVTIEKDN